MITLTTSKGTSPCRRVGRLRPPTNRVLGGRGNDPEALAVRQLLSDKTGDCVREVLRRLLSPGLRVACHGASLLGCASDDKEEIDSGSRKAASSTAERKDARRTRCGSPIALLAGEFVVGDFHLIGESAGERVEITEVGAQVAQHAADGVAVIVGAVLAVVNGVSAAAVGVSFEQAELT